MNYADQTFPIDIVKIDRQSLEATIRKQNLKRWWVAEFSGIHRTTLQRWLRGTIHRAHIETLERVARTLSVSTEALMEKH